MLKTAVRESHLNLERLCNDVVKEEEIVDLSLETESLALYISHIGSAMINNVYNMIEFFH